MSTPHVLLTLALWYGPGFLAAAHMTRRGHDPLPWVFGAWIVGALLVVVAALSLLVDAQARRRRPRRHHERPEVLDLTSPRSPARETVSRR